MSIADFRAEFAFFSEHPQWVYLDNAATSHKPHDVVVSMQQFYQRDNSNVHRSAHSLAATATTQLEQARHDILQFVNASADYQLIFSAGATMALNQLAFGLMHSVLQAGDLVVVSSLEHHANIVPWQFHCKGVELQAIPLTANGELDLAAYQQLLQRKPKIVSLTQLSNGTGYAPDLSMLLPQAKAVGALTIVDGCQGVAAGLADVTALDCDFYVCSAHKLYGPTGIGALIGKTSALERLRPLCYGGEMIRSVSFSHTELNRLPYRLEAGTPNIAGAIGFGAAVRFLQQFDTQQLTTHKLQLTQSFMQALHEWPQIRVLSPQNSAGIVTCVVAGAHAQDFAELLNVQQVAVRAGSHCAMPLFAALQQPGAVRFSFAPYNNQQDVQRAVDAIRQAMELL